MCTTSGKAVNELHNNQSHYFLLDRDQAWWNFINTKNAAHLRNTLEEHWHSQPTVSIKSNNLMAYCILTNKNNISPIATKLVGMHFHWLRCLKPGIGAISYLMEISESCTLLDQEDNHAKDSPRKYTVSEIKGGIQTHVHRTSTSSRHSSFSQETRMC